MVGVLQLSESKLETYLWYNLFSFEKINREPLWTAHRL